MSAFLPWSPDVEARQQNEEEDVRIIRDSFGRLRDHTFDKHRHALRDAHAKSHGILSGQLEVVDTLPPELAQGVFADPATYSAVVRFSTSPGDIFPDGIAALRGMAIKILGVRGEQLLPERPDAATQDFLLCNHPAFAVRDLHAYRRQALLLEKSTIHSPEELLRLGTTVLRAGAAVVRRLGADATGGAGGQAMPQTHPLGETYWSQAALRYGDHVAKVRVAPASPELTALTGRAIDTGNPSVLRDLVTEHFRRSGGEWDLQVQLATDLDRTPVEDASVVWPEDHAPFRTVARLTVPPQDTYSPARRVYADDVLSFNPWHGVVEHQPLGSLQRARRPVYDDSIRDRHERNAVPAHEPATVDELPD